MEIVCIALQLCQRSVQFPCSELGSLEVWEPHCPKEKTKSLFTFRADQLDPGPGGLGPHNSAFQAVHRLGDWKGVYDPLPMGWGGPGSQPLYTQLAPTNWRRPALPPQLREVWREARATAG
jgi:hypothetical protein